MSQKRIKDPNAPRPNKKKARKAEQRLMWARLENLKKLGRAFKSMKQIKEEKEIEKSLNEMEKNENENPNT